MLKITCEILDKAKNTCEILATEFMNTRIYLDTRNSHDNSDCPLRYAIAKNGKTAYINLDIKVKPMDWDARLRRVGSSNKNYRRINATIERRKIEYDDLVNEIATRQMTALQIRDAVLAKLDPNDKTLLLPRFKAFAESRTATRTREIYEQTYNKIRCYDKKADKLCFEDIDKRWLADFNNWLIDNGCVADSTRGIHLRNICAVFNDALDDEVIKCYPFRKFSIPKGQPRHRALEVEDLRKIIFHDVEEHQKVYRDMFLLSFLLIGCNPADLYDAPKTNIVAGRYEYTRKKTGKFYSVKIEPEAMTIINKYEGHDTLLNILRPNESVNEYCIKLDKQLQRIGVWEVHPKSHNKALVKAFNPKLSIYWARHSWATIAINLDIPKDTISMALGHSVKSVTDTYIQFDRKKIDEANRRVIDYVLYGKDYRKTESMSN